MLISQNYLEKSQNSSLRVASVSEEQLFDIYEVRSFLEEKIIEKIVNEITKKQLKDLKLLITYLEMATVNENQKEVFRIMDEIHGYLAITLNNTILLEILNTTNLHISRYRSLFSKVSQTDMNAILENHEMIFFYISKKDKKNAKEQIVKWNNISMKFLRKRLKELNFI